MISADAAMISADAAIQSVRDEMARAEKFGGTGPHEREISMMLEITRLTNAVARLVAERDDADRRAGAAERHLAAAQEAAAARALWLSNAKAAWGVDDSMSFDDVWEQALALRATARTP